VGEISGGRRKRRREGEMKEPWKEEMKEAAEGKWREK
jgi:hypothetical protein